MIRDILKKRGYEHHVADNLELKVLDEYEIAVKPYFYEDRVSLNYTSLFFAHEDKQSVQEAIEILQVIKEGLDEK